MKRITKDNYFKTSDNVHIYFEDYGKGDPIVFLPGYLCTADMFKANIEGLSKNNRVIVLDLRGFGNSENTLSNLTIDRCAQDVKELFDFLNLERVTLIGWSMAGTVVTSYYEQFRNYRLKAVGLIDSCLFPFEDVDHNPHHLRNYNVDLLSATVEKVWDDYTGYCRGFSKGIFGKDPSEEVGDRIYNEMKKTPPWVALTLYNSFALYDGTGVLPEITVPVFLGATNSRTIATSVEMTKYYREQIKAKTYFHDFTGLGHIMFYEDSETFNKVILDFLKFADCEYNLRNIT